MQFSVIALFAVAASVSYAQSIESELAKIPACGMTCIATASQNAGCTPYDYQCQCVTQREVITQAAIPCIASSCQPSDLAAITQASTEICRLATLQNMSGSVTGATGATASTSTSASTRTGSSTATQRASTTTTSSAAVVSNTKNAASSNVRFGVAGAAIGLGAVFAAVAL